MPQLRPGIAKLKNKKIALTTFLEFLVLFIPLHRSKSLVTFPSVQRTSFNIPFFFIFFFFLSFFFLVPKPRNENISFIVCLLATHSLSFYLSENRYFLGLPWWSSG